MSAKQDLSETNSDLLKGEDNEALKPNTLTK